MDGSDSEMRYRRFGALGEIAAREWCKKQGYYIVPTSLIENGGAPMLEGETEKAILPDVLMAIKGASVWVDFKTKRRGCPSAKRQRPESGFATRHVNNYQRVAKETGIPCGILFVHALEERFFFGLLEKVLPTAAEYDGPKFGEPMTFFDLRLFDQFRFETNEAIIRLQGAVIEPISRKPWETNENIIAQADRKAPTHKQERLF
jgi:hypothetical protein